jgi:hypothetical protein
VGDLGWLSLNTMPEALLDAVLSDDSTMMHLGLWLLALPSAILLLLSRPTCILAMMNLSS